MDPKSIEPAAQETLDLYGRVKAWLDVPPTAASTGGAIPPDDPPFRPNSFDLGTAWANLDFAVPDEARRDFSGFSSGFSSVFGEVDVEFEGPSGGESAPESRTRQTRDKGA